MAFGWSPVTQGVTKAKKQHLNEIKNATDSLASDLGIGSYSWTHLPIERGEKILYNQLTDLRSGLDYVHDNNTCSADYTSVNTGDDTTDNITDNNTDDYNEDGTYHSPYYNNYHNNDYDPLHSLMKSGDLGGDR